MECGLYNRFYVENCKIFYNVPLSAAHPRFNNDRLVSCNDDSVRQEASVYYSGIYWCGMGNDKFNNYDGAWNKWHQNMFFSFVSAFYILYSRNYNDVIQNSEKDCYLKMI